MNNAAGFAASTIYRGLQFIQVPTTALAQADAAIDFKQAIDVDRGKNLIGSYCAATAIVITPSVLASLDDREVSNDFAEIIKHDLIEDPILLRRLEQYNGHMTDQSFLEEVIGGAVELKSRLVNGDVGNMVNEMLPQYGHAIGHAVEAASDYRILHGEAMSIGMCASAHLACGRGLCDLNAVKAHHRVLRKCNLPTCMPQWLDLEIVIDALSYDKHCDGRVKMIRRVSIPTR